LELVIRILYKVALGGRKKGFKGSDAAYIPNNIKVILAQNQKMDSVLSEHKAHPQNMYMMIYMGDDRGQRRARHFLGFLFKFVNKTEGNIKR
jgi:hypothetical protein